MNSRPLLGAGLYRRQFINGVRFHSHSHGEQPCSGHSHSHTDNNTATTTTTTTTNNATKEFGNTTAGIDLNDYAEVQEEKGIHHYYEVETGKPLLKTATIRNGEVIQTDKDFLLGTKKPNKVSHGHSHAEYPELDQMDFSGEDFTINLNPKKDTTWSKVKDFFNPHTPLAHMFGNPKDGAKHGGHTHSHSGSVELYDTKNLANEGVKITWIGFGVNASMAITKFIGGVMFHSQALIADAVHAVGDLISDVLTLSTVKFTNKKPNSLYPLGYGKIETFGSFMVSFILLYAGFQIGWSSFYEMVAPLVPNALHDLMAWIPAHSHSHSHGVDVDVSQGADINAAWLALGSIAVKEWLFRATKSVGEKLNSKVLIANAWHHRVDSLTSVVAVCTISAGYFLNIYWMDCVGGLMVSMLIMKVGISGVVQSFKELIDKALPRDDPKYGLIEDSINVSLMKKNSHVLIKELNILPSGTNMNIVLKLGVSKYDKAYENELTLDKMGEIGESLKIDIGKEFQSVKNVSVQFISNEEIKLEKEKEEKS